MLYQISILHYLLLSSFVFSAGIMGLLINRGNIILTLMSIELLLLSANINFVTFSYYFNDALGHLFSVFILMTAAAESAVGLAIIIVHFRNKSSIDLDGLKMLRG